MATYIRACILFLLFLFSANTFACDCVGRLSANDADVVFEGQVLSIVLLDTVNYNSYNIMFKVLKKIKGKTKSDTLNVWQRYLSFAACGYEFELHKKYFVVASGDKDTLYTSACTETYELTP